MTPLTALTAAFTTETNSFDGKPLRDSRRSTLQVGFGFKPLVLAETEEFVAIATEEVALRQALGRSFVAREPTPGTMRIWNTPAAVSAVQ